MTQVKIKDQVFPATVTGLVRDPSWNDRESKTIHTKLSYEQAAALFTDDTPWSILYQAPAYPNDEGKMITPEPVEYDNTDYCRVGSISVNRDGTVDVKMGKMTAAEMLSDLIGPTPTLSQFHSFSKMVKDLMAKGQV